MCRQVPKPIKLLEGIGNGGNSALIQQYCEQMIIISYFCDLLRSIGSRGTALPPNANFGLSHWS